MVQQHEILRTNYFECDGAVTGVVRDAFTVPFATVDFSGLPATERESAAEQWMVKESGLVTICSTCHPVVPGWWLPRRCWARACFGGGCRDSNASSERDGTQKMR